MQLGSEGTRFPIKNIFLVTDGAPWDDIAILYGIDLAKQHAARLQVMHVVSSSLHNKILETDSYSDRRPEEKSFIRRKTVQRVRFPIALLQILDLQRFDLVIASSTREGEMKGLGEAVERILFSVDSPVLVIGPGISRNDVPRAKARTILYATDFSRQSFHAAQHAFSWAQQHQAWLTMLHVVEGIRQSSLYLPEALVEPFRRWMEELVPDEVELWSEVENRIEFGEVSEGILNTAEKVYADLIVLGANALSDVGESAVSSKTTQVLLRAECPVLLVREEMRKRHSLRVANKRQLVAA